MFNPFVSVIMPVFNCEKFVKQAIDSILNQTFQSFEFIIVDDGSTDNTPKIVKSYSDSRICFYQNKKNIGLAASLNIALEKAQGKYIVRMDGDDISLPQRIEKQVEFMEDKPDVDVSSFYIKFLNNNRKIIKVPKFHKDILCNLLFTSPLIHPAIIFRMETIEKYKIRYNIERKIGQDYDLWIEYFDKLRFANIPEVYLFYREDPGNVKKENRKIIMSKLLQKGLLEKLGVQFSDDELQIHHMLSRNTFVKSTIFIKKVDKWLCKLYLWNTSSKVFEKKILKQLFEKKWLHVLDYQGANKLTKLFWIITSSFFSVKFKLSFLKSNLF